MSESQQYTVRLAGGEEFGPAEMPLIAQWAREGRVPKDASLVPAGGGEPISVLSRPEIAWIINAPPTMQGHVGAGQSSGDEGIATLIPYRNPQALTGYYLSIASLIPLVGTVAGPIAIWLGVAGLGRRKADPRIHGLAHAWVAIILGAIGTLISLGCIGGVVLSIFAA